MDWSRDLIVCGAGFVAGMMNSIAGGGTVVTFPALIWAGLTGLEANVTSTVALFPGMPVSAWAFRKHLGELKSWLKILAPVSLVGGLAGGVLLLKAGSSTFDFIVPWLLLLATILFLTNDLISRWVRRRLSAPASDGAGKLHPLGIVFFCGVAVYGGYFGAGIGIMMLAALGLLGLTDINQMNALKVILAMLMNFSAVVWFIYRGGVNWPLACWLMAGSIFGYWYGSIIAMRIPPVWVRRVGAFIGLVISVVLFVKQRMGSS